MRVRILLVGCVFLAAHYASSQTIDVPQRTLTVSGTGYVTAPSDRAILHVAFESEGPTAEEAIASHEVELDRVRTTLARAGIADEAIREERYSLHRRDGDESGFSDEPLEKHVLSQSIIVTLDTIDLVETLVSELAQENEAGLEELFRVNRRSVDTEFVIKDRAPFEDEALQIAINRARTRAELAATEAGVRLGGVVAIREQGLFGAPMGGFEQMSEAMMSMPGMALLSGEQRIGANVVVMFEIE